MIVDHAPSSDQEKAEIVKDVPEKKSGWISGWFGGQAKQTQKTDDQESRSQPDGAEGGSSSDIPSKKKNKSEHVVVPNKGITFFRTS